MRVGSLFAGIGGFDLACERAGMSCAWQVEIEPRAQDVLRFHWPDVERHADVREVGSATLAPVDLIVGGFPCQDLSVAGRRAGLGGERSGLFWQLVRVVREVRPRWLLLENVGGLLSSNGWRDLGTVLGALGECGYMGAFRCLDSQHFGVPQRRYRIFIVGHLGAPCPAEVLLEPDCLPGDLAAREQAREDLAATLTHGVASGGRGGYAGRRREDDVNLVAGTIGSDHGNVRADQAWTGRLVQAFPITAREGKGPASSADSGNLLALPLRAQHNASHRADSDTYIAHTLRAEDGTGRGTPLVAQPLRAGRQYSDMGDGTANVVPVAFNWQSGGDCRQRPSEAGTDALHAGQVPAVGFALNQRREGRLQEVAGSVHEPSGTQIDGALTPMGVRRLTPRECERLQGFPDDWTKYGRNPDGSTYWLKDAPRYRALGNAVTVNVAEWIARRLMTAAADAPLLNIEATHPEGKGAGGGEE